MAESLSEVGLSDPKPRTLRELQSLFVILLGHLFDYATSKGLALTLGEGFVRQLRKTREGQIVDDGVHMAGSVHYLGLAMDLNLFNNGVWVREGTDAAWKDLGEYWESLHTLCRWGGRFKSVDSNHFSITYEGRA